MNQNIFVEKHPAERGKGLGCINVSRLELSIQQHGLGVVNRSVSVAYTILWEVCMFHNFAFDLSPCIHFTSSTSNPNFTSILSSFNFTPIEI